MKKILIFISLLSLSAAASAESCPYKDSSLSPAERTKDLLARMTLDEKLMQLQCIWGEQKRAMFPDGKFDIVLAKQQLPNGLGSMVRPNEDLRPNPRMPHQAFGAKDGANQYNEIQRYFVEQTRLGIPVLMHDEGVHGVWTQDATNFPVPIALASTWDEALISELYTATALEMRSRGAYQALGPVLDMMRDPRWGRTEETWGEDPYLITRLGKAAVSAMQGKPDVLGYLDDSHVGVTLKHFGVHGAPEGGHNTAPSFVDEHEARSSFLTPFREVIKSCDPFYVMVTYNEIWGKPAHANRHLLQDILRHEYGFRGTVVSDYGAINRTYEVDRMAPSRADAAALCINAGIDVELPNPETFVHLHEMIETGKVSMEVIDRAVTRVLFNKFRLGLFDCPYVDIKRAERVNGNNAHRQLAYRAAAEAMVLLKNENDFLPLDKKKVKRIALIGPNANRCILGGYSGMPQDTITPLRAIRERFGDRMEILYAEGCRLTDHHSPFPYAIRAITAKENALKIREAVETARQADVVVLFVGGNEGMSREAYDRNALGDLASLELTGGQLELIRAITTLNKPVCAFVNGGTTYDIVELESLVPAVMQCWYLGQEGGYAMIDALFGEINPSGRLPLSYPRSAGHIPSYYNYKPSSRLGYNLGGDASPLHPFGYGLSYTTFAYSNLRLDKTEMSSNEVLNVSIDIQNTGHREGVEVVQLYLSDDYASMTRPVKELKDFRRINLKAGEKQTVTFSITSESLSFYDDQYRWQCEPGTFTIAIGPSSSNTKKATFSLNEKCQVKQL